MSKRTNPHTHEAREDGTASVKDKGCDVELFSEHISSSSECQDKDFDASIEDLDDKDGTEVCPGTVCIRPNDHVCVARKPAGMVRGPKPRSDHLYAFQRRKEQLEALLGTAICL
jgi:hypothetical protein